MLSYSVFKENQAVLYNGLVSVIAASSVVKYGAQAFINPQRYLDSVEDYATIIKYNQEIEDPDTALILTVSEAPIENIFDCVHWFIDSSGRL